jgi:DNA-binding transcriptional regulator LsrR (DeoR family)
VNPCCGKQSIKSTIELAYKSDIVLAGIGLLSPRGTADSAWYGMVSWNRDEFTEIHEQGADWY